MAHQTDARPYLPAAPDAGISQLRQAAEKCRGCELYKNATQVAFGEGKNTSKVILIGEQPGDQEDLRGRPFVGPAGMLLDRALAEAEMERKDVYVTNAVKHFKWKPDPRGKRRLHAKPGAREVHACHPWLEREISLLAAGDRLPRRYRRAAPVRRPISPGAGARKADSGHPLGTLRRGHGASLGNFAHSRSG